MDEVSNQYAFTYAKLASQRSFEQESAHILLLLPGFHSQYLSLYVEYSAVHHELCIVCVCPHCRTFNGYR